MFTVRITNADGTGTSRGRVFKTWSLTKACRSALVWSRNPDNSVEIEHGSTVLFATYFPKFSEALTATIAHRQDYDASEHGD